MPFRLLLWLFCNGRRFDALHIYHLRAASLLYATLFRVLNPKAKIHLTLDADENIFRYFIPHHPRRGMAIALLGLCDSASAETERIVSRLRAILPPNLRDRLFLNPYGLDVETLRPTLKGYHRKKKILLQMGRLGTYQKNSELLLEALSLVPPPQGWRVWLAGPAQPAFLAKLEAFRRRNPRWADRIEWLGEVYDPDERARIFKQSALFCLTSRFESWGLVLAEAAYYGCLIVSTDTGCASEILRLTRMGDLVPPDPHALAEVLTRRFRTNPNPKTAYRIHRRASLMDDWDTVARRLWERLSSFPP